MATSNSSLPVPTNGDQDNGPAILVPVLVLMVFATICVILRTYTRLVITRNFKWDDGSIIAALVNYTIPLITFSN